MSRGPHEGRAQEEKSENILTGHCSSTIPQRRAARVHEEWNVSLLDLDLSRRVILLQRRLKSSKNYFETMSRSRMQ